MYALNIGSIIKRVFEKITEKNKSEQWWQNITETSTTSKNSNTVLIHIKNVYILM